jgi:RNA polymerase sigma-70 factor, ECF subfamily
MQHGPIDLRMAFVAVTTRPPRVEPLGDAEQFAARALRIAYRAALGVLGSREAAEDIAQEVALKALLRAGSVRDPERADAWLYRVATRAALREARRIGTRRRAERALYDRQGGEVVEAASSQSADILVLLDGLAPRQRAALTLRYVFDLPDETIAAAMGCRAATVRSHLFHGRAALRSRLENEGGQGT